MRKTEAEENRDRNRCEKTCEDPGQLGPHFFGDHYVVKQEQKTERNQSQRKSGECGGPVFKIHFSGFFVDRKKLERKR